MTDPKVKLIEAYTEVFDEILDEYIELDLSTTNNMLYIEFEKATGSLLTTIFKMYPKIHDPNVREVMDLIDAYKLRFKRRK